MHNIINHTGLLVLLVLLAGCGSSPSIEHYFLTAKPAEPPFGDTPSLGIGPVQIPEYLNRSALVYSRQGNKLKVSNTAHWAEPLEDGLQRVLSLNIGVLVGTQNVRMFPWDPHRAPDYGIKITLLHLDANDSEAHLVAESLIYRPDNSATVRRRTNRVSLPLTNGPLSTQDIAPAYSELLYRLSEIIANDIKADLISTGTAQGS